MNNDIINFKNYDMENEMNKTLVSICCIAYNQKNYIKQCLDGILMQKTNFKFEVLIHDDCSTDGTTEIIKEYEQKYPDIIKPIYENENQFSKGISISKVYNFPRVKSKYVTICEGDDYWTDQYKLQKQVDFMEQNPDYTICFHNVKRLFEKLPIPEDIFPAQVVQSSVFDFSFNSLLECNFIPTNSVMYRWDSVENVVDKFPNSLLPGDWYLHLLFAKQGKIHFIEDVMSVYRINGGGIWGAVPQEIRLLRFSLKIFNFYFNVYKNFAYKNQVFYHELLKICENIQTVNFKYKKYTVLIKFFLKYPKLNIRAFFRKNILFARILYDNFNG